MIIQSLTTLYERLAASEDPDRRLPEPGWKENEISFVIDLAADGTPVNLVPLRVPQEKGRPRAPMRAVPLEAKRTGKIAEEPEEKDCWKASLFWDNPRYALGIASGDDTKSLRDAAVCHGLFRFRHEKFARDAGAAVAADAGMRAVLNFLAKEPLSALAKGDPAWVKDIREAGGNIAFRLDGDTDLICRRPAIRAAISAAAVADQDAGQASTGQCLVTGQMTRIARLHPSIQGVAGAQTSGANVVSFNLPAFESYGLAQGENAPVGTYAAFAYTTALNALLRANSRFRARAGNTTVVFWAGQETPNEAAVCDLMAAVAEDRPDGGIEVVDAIYRAPGAGHFPPIDDPTAFFILGLSAESKSRLTVRFFHQGTVAEASRTIKCWFDQLDIMPKGPLSLTRLRRALSVLGDLKNTPPLLEAELTHAAYTGAPLPQRVLGEALTRCAAEQGPTRERAALIKAFLIRNLNREITVELDPDETHPAYRLGRLFAVLENIQRTAVRPKRTIRDSYWGSAAATPAAVFPQLLDLAMSHLGKIKQDRPGLAYWFEEQIGEITNETKFPRSLKTHHSFEEQGRFAIGYWQQRFKPKPEKIAAEEVAALEQEGETT